MGRVDGRSCGGGVFNNGAGVIERDLPRLATVHQAIPGPVLVGVKRVLDLDIGRTKLMKPRGHEAT